MGHCGCYTKPNKAERMRKMLGVFMCYLMLQMVLLEGLWSRKAEEESVEKLEEVSSARKKAC